jgi:transposase
MTLYHNFIGIDIGKFEFVSHVFGRKETQTYANNPEGFSLFLEAHADLMQTAFCVLETTGGYELDLWYTLIDRKIVIHRADTRKVKNFIRSYGNAAKTDRLDAQALAKYGRERFSELEPFKPQSQHAIQLFKILQRRIDLKKILVAEKNRNQQDSIPLIEKGREKLITVLTEELETLNAEILKVIQGDPLLKAKHQILQKIPGIGEKIGYELLILLPELGTLNRRQIASLAGLAPLSNESGKFKGYRRMGHGRQGIKSTMFLAAMAARNSKTHLKEFYEKLITKGKAKLVALAALMRKIRVIANAKIRDFMLDSSSKQKLQDAI